MNNSVERNAERIFRTLFDQYKNDIFAYAYRFFRSREQSEEIVQDVFVKIWQNIDTIDLENNVKSYIFTVARNTTYNKLKSFAIQQTYLNDIFYRHVASSNTVEELVHYRELKQVYDQAISALPTQRQRIFRLSREEHMSHEEIAQQLNISKNTVKDQIVKSLKFIKQYLESNAELTTVIAVFYHYLQKK
ncbi:RNA polymerase sigma-70 factor [Sphingobacterium luzhongxinii]|uniref:RNA polymerase sigma-70 factor n=1 Tax=Sphingobacterium luzhongxinii TaxID=2654181 RepID=UPI0013DBE92C|nr:RNA polymerase sigma-70 factor [Sphingobacterium sp. xlx-73]